jgi:hypothetical protein
MLIIMSSSRRVLVVLFGIFLALGMSLSAVQAGAMPVKMTAVADMGTAGHCKGCGDKGDSAKGMTPCSLGCVNLALAPNPESNPTRIVHLAVFSPPQNSLLLGRAFSPDPGPPRSLDIG